MMLACGGALVVEAQAQTRGSRPGMLKPAPRAVSTFPLQRTPPRLTRRDTLPPRDRWLAPDKGKHVAASFFLALGGQYLFEEKARLQRDSALALSLGTGAAVGVGKELYDGFLGRTGRFSFRDLVADALGLLLAGVVVVL